MAKRVLRRNAGKRFEGDLAERTTRSCQRDASDRREIFTYEALPESVVLAIDRPKAVPRPA